MIEFSRAITNGSMVALDVLYLQQNLIGDAGMIEFSRSVASGSLPKCNVMFVSGNPGNTAPLKAACEERGINLFT
jgi:hypothetical protein